MSDVFDECSYDKDATKKSPIIVPGTLVDYADMVERNGGETNIKDISVIDLDAIADSLKSAQKPPSMDFALVIRKTKNKKYICADLKLNVTSLKKVDKNISNDSIKAKFSFSQGYIRSKGFEIPVSDIAYFIFKDKNFEQIRNTWKRRDLNRPKNEAVKQSDFERLF